MYNYYIIKPKINMDKNNDNKDNISILIIIISISKFWII